MSNYRVGQVLYVILKKETRVYPIQIVEEITKKTLNGDQITYMVKGGTSSELTPLSDIDGEVFSTPENARQTLVERVTTMISQRVEQAVEKAREWYPSGFTSNDETNVFSLKKKEKQAVQQPASKKPHVSQEALELANELKSETEETFVELPDGTKAKVRNVKLPSSLQG